MSVQLIEVSPTNSRVMDQKSVTIPKIDDLIIDYLAVFPDGTTDRLEKYIKYYDVETLKNIIYSFVGNSIFNYYQSINYKKMYNFLLEPAFDSINERKLIPSKSPKVPKLYLKRV
jgi:hypothetical protein